MCALSVEAPGILCFNNAVAEELANLVLVNFCLIEMLDHLRDFGMLFGAMFHCSTLAHAASYFVLESLESKVDVGELIQEFTIRQRTQGVFGTIWSRHGPSRQSKSEQ